MAAVSPRVISFRDSLNGADKVNAELRQGWQRKSFACLAFERGVPKNHQQQTLFFQKGVRVDVKYEL